METFRPYFPDEIDVKRTTYPQKKKGQVETTLLISLCLCREVDFKQLLVTQSHQVEVVDQGGMTPLMHLLRSAEARFSRVLALLKHQKPQVLFDSRLNSVFTHLYSRSVVKYRQTIGLTQHLIRCFGRKAFVDAYQARWDDYPRIGSLVGYMTVQSIAAALRDAGVREFDGRVLPRAFGLPHWTRRRSAAGRSAYRWR